MNGNESREILCTNHVSAVVETSLNRSFHIKLFGRGPKC